jgi:DNA-binding response OmpR family regulator
MTNTRNILVVEDEPLIAMMLEDFIDMMGHRIGAAVGSVADALAEIEAQSFDLAILDLNLGKETSWPVAAALQDRGIPFVLATGGNLQAPSERHAGARTLTKPYTYENVQASIDALAGV